MRHCQLVAGFLVVLSACGSKRGDRPDPEAAVEVRAPVAVEAELFPPAARRLLALPALALLPADTAGVVVVADPSGLSDRLGLCDDDRGGALGRDLKALIGFDLLHAAKDGAARSLATGPVAVAWLDRAATRRLLLFAATDVGAVREGVDAATQDSTRPGKKPGKGKQGKRRRVVSRLFERDGQVAVVLGPPSQEILDQLAAVTAETGLSSAPGFAATSAALEYGDDLAVYLDPGAHPTLRGSGGLAVGATLEGATLRTVAALALAPVVTVPPVPVPSPSTRVGVWITGLGERIGVDLAAPPPAAVEPTLSRVLAASHPDATVRVSLAAIDDPPPTDRGGNLLARDVALRDAAEFGMIGLLGTTTASEKQRAERDRLRTQLRDLEAQRDQQTAGMLADLSARLGYLALFVRARGEVALFYGGVFLAAPPTAVVDDVVALWHLGSAHSAPGGEIAALETQVETLERSIERIESRAIASMFGSFDSSMFGSTDVYGGLIGDSGFGGIGISGIGQGGGCGTGSGTIGIGSYGTLGHGSGGGTGYGSSGGRSGRGGSARGASGAATSGSGSGPASPSATTDPEGQLDSAVIQSYIAKREGRLQNCRQPGVEGQARIQFAIKSDGWVDGVSASGLGNQEVEACLEGIFETFQFPAPSDGEVRTSHIVVFD